MPFRRPEPVYYDIGMYPFPSQGVTNNSLMELKEYYLKLKGLKHLETGCNLGPALEAVIRRHPQQQQSALEADDLEVTVSPGVEGLGGSHTTHPPVMEAPARKKRKRKQTKTQAERCQQKKTDNKVGGTRRVKSKKINKETNPNDRTYLAKAITAHFSDKKTEIIHQGSN